MRVPSWLAYVIAAAVAWGALGEQVRSLGGRATDGAANATKNSALLARVEEQIDGLRDDIGQLRRAVEQIDADQSTVLESIRAQLRQEESARIVLTRQVDLLADRVERITAAPGLRPQGEEEP